MSDTKHSSAGSATERDDIAKTIWLSEYRRATGKERNITWYDVSDADRDKYLFIADAILALRVEERRCQKCGCPTEGEEAWVHGQVWCHPCADAAPQAASRQIGFMEAMNMVDLGFDTWKDKPHNAKWYSRIDGTPIPNDLKVNIAEAIVHYIASRCQAETGK